MIWGRALFQDMGQGQEPQLPVSCRTTRGSRCCFSIVHQAIVFLDTAFSILQVCIASTLLPAPALEADDDKDRDPARTENFRSTCSPSSPVKLLSARDMERPTYPAKNFVYVTVYWLQTTFPTRAIHGPWIPCSLPSTLIKRGTFSDTDGTGRTSFLMM